jgi:hypothetical protein
VKLAEKVADDSHPPPSETLPDLVAAALADRDYNRAIELLNQKQNSGGANGNDVLLLTYLYCLNRDVPKAESIANRTPDRSEPLTKWLWEKLRAEYGFHPPD